MAHTERADRMEPLTEEQECLACGLLGSDAVLDAHECPIIVEEDA